MVLFMLVAVSAKSLENYIYVNDTFSTWINERYRKVILPKTGLSVNLVIKMFCPAKNDLMIRLTDFR